MLKRESRLSLSVGGTMRRGNIAIPCGAINGSWSCRSWCSIPNERHYDEVYGVRGTAGSQVKSRR